VHFRGEELGRGKGKSKKAAESQAANAALQGLRQNPIQKKQGEIVD
jgi:dsRNA-specific ribonuclease